MARNMYGATSADFTLTSGGRVVPGATLTIWSARTGGTQITDLLDRDSVAATTVTSGADGSVVYYGPADDISVHWADSGQGARVAIRPVDIVGPTSVAADHLRVWGNSYLDPTGAGPDVTSSNNTAAILGEVLGLPVRNEAIGGAYVYQSVDQAGSVCDILQKVTRPARFSGPSGLHVTLWGINDLNKLGNTTTALKPFFAAYRAVISRLRQGAIFENDHSSVVYGGVSWTPVSMTSSNSGSGLHYCGGTPGGTVTITTPSEFPGGTLVLGVISWDTNGGTLSGTINGQTYSINTADWAIAGKNVPGVLRIPNVPAGAASYTFTVTAVTASPGLVFDYWAWEPPQEECPVIAVIKPPKPIDYTAYGSTAPGPPTDTGMDNIGAGLDSLVAEFDSRVRAVDVSAINKSATYWSAGDVHPNARGHLYIAHKVAEALGDVVFSARAGSVYSPRIDYGTAAPTGPSTKYFVGDRVWNTAPAEAGTGGSKYVTLGWICTVAGAPGTWLPMRVLTGN